MIFLIIVFFILILLSGFYLYGLLSRRKAEAKFPPAGTFVEVEGIKLHYICKGEGEKNVVLLHGGILSAKDYSSVLDLGSQDYRMFSFDRPGYGYSQLPKEERVTAIDQASLLHKALKELKVEKPVIAGHSMSGLVVLAYALQYPDDLSGILLLGAAGYGGKAYPAGDGDLLSCLVNTPIIGHLFLHTFLVPLGKMAMKSMLVQTFAPDPIPDGYIEETKAIWLRPNQFKANRKDILAFSLTARDLSKRYPTIRVPTVVVVGEHDPFNPQQQSYQLHKDIPESDLMLLPNTGHMIPQVRPDAVIEAVGMVWKKSGTYE